MVKLSRRQVKKRSLRRRTAKKRVMKRRAMKGGYKRGELGTFNRQKVPGLILYTVTIEKDETGENIRYILDFSTAGSLTTYIMGKKNIDEIMAEYTKTLIEAFKVTNNGSQDLIADAIKQIFEGGIDLAKTRKLSLTDMKDSQFVQMQLFENDDMKGKVITFEKGVGGDMGLYYENLTSGFGSGWKLKSVNK